MNLLEELHAVHIADCITRPLTNNDRLEARNESRKFPESKRSHDHLTYGATWLWRHGTQDLREGNVARGRWRRAAAIGLAIPNLTNIYPPLTLALTLPVLLGDHYKKPHSDAAVREHVVVRDLRDTARRMREVNITKMAKDGAWMGSFASPDELRVLSFNLRKDFSTVAEQAASVPRLRDSKSVRNALRDANKAADAWDNRLRKVEGTQSLRQERAQRAAIKCGGYMPI